MSRCPKCAVRVHPNARVQKIYGVAGTLVGAAWALGCALLARGNEKLNRGGVPGIGSVLGAVASAAAAGMAAGHAIGEVIADNSASNSACPACGSVTNQTFSR